MRARLLKYDDMFYFYLTTPTATTRAWVVHAERQILKDRWRARSARVVKWGGVYYTELHYFTLHFWLFLCMV